MELLLSYLFTQITNIHLLPESRSDGSDSLAVDGRTMAPTSSVGSSVGVNGSGNSGAGGASGTVVSSSRTGTNYDVCFTFASTGNTAEQSASVTKSLLTDSLDQMPVGQASQLQLSAYDIHYDPTTASATYGTHPNVPDHTAGTSTFYIATTPFDLNYGHDTVTDSVK